MKLTQILGIILLSCLIWNCSGDTNEEPIDTPTGITGDGTLQNVLEVITDEYDVPALAALIVDDEGTLEFSAVGKRAVESDSKVSLDDLWHIGSITKSITSTLAAITIEEGFLNWDSTIIEVFPELQGVILQKYEHIELQQLLSMTSGLKDDFENPIYASLDLDDFIIDVRQEATVLSLSFDHELLHGDYEYANVNYIIAAAMIEQVYGDSWENLLAEKVFSALSLYAYGMGAPGSEDSVDQPRGHHINDMGQLESVYLDNPALLAPAGRVHISLEGMAQYLIFHLRAHQGNVDLISQSNAAKLYEDVGGHNYALGWQIDHATGNPWHNGSNTFWYAHMELDPKRNIAIFVVTNAATQNAQIAVQLSLDVLSERFDASK